ncbi:hypothetical protein FS842_009626 [Serendipita sp. 407]|nr:hypothetical protein FS842_009626 [Serendipita sp. 407]
MNGAGWLFLFSVLLAAVLLFTMVFFIIMFSDLECDYINPIDLCTQLNRFVLPEYIAHGFLALLFLLSGQFMALALNLPLVAYNVRKYANIFTHTPSSSSCANSVHSLQSDGWRTRI